MVATRVYISADPVSVLARLGTLIEQACGSMSFPLTDDMEGPAERAEACAARGPNEQTKVGMNVVELVMDREQEQDGMMLTSAG
jgi:hypothetical protein